MTNSGVYVVEPCASANAYEIKFKDKKLNLDNIDFCDVLAKTNIVLVGKYYGYAVSFYESGRVMIKGIKGEEAPKISKKLISDLEKSKVLV